MLKYEKKRNPSLIFNHPRGKRSRTFNDPSYSSAFDFPMAVSADRMSLMSRFHPNVETVKRAITVFLERHPEFQTPDIYNSLNALVEKMTTNPEAFAELRVLFKSMIVAMSLDRAVNKWLEKKVFKVSYVAKAHSSLNGMPFVGNEWSKGGVWLKTIKKVYGKTGEVDYVHYGTIVLAMLDVMGDTRIQAEVTEATTNTVTPSVGYVVRV